MTETPDPRERYFALIDVVKMKVRVCGTLSAGIYGDTTIEHQASEPHLVSVETDRRYTPDELFVLDDLVVRRRADGASVAIKR